MTSKKIDITYTEVQALKEIAEKYPNGYIHSKGRQVLWIQRGERE